MTSASTVATLAGVGGVAGWAGERVYRAEPHYSAAFGGAPVPFLPVYAAGAAAIALAAPHLAGLPWLVRASAYSSLLTGVELGACAIDRAAGHCSWSYGADGCPRGDCVDLPHAIVWGVLGLVAEQAALALERRRAIRKRNGCPRRRV